MFTDSIATLDPATEHQGGKGRVYKVVDQTEQSYGSPKPEMGKEQKTQKAQWDAALDFYFAFPGPQDIN